MRPLICFTPPRQARWRIAFAPTLASLAPTHKFSIWGFWISDRNFQMLLVLGFLCTEAFSMDSKLVVLGIPWDIDTEGLREYMSKFGELEDCIVMKVEVHHKCTLRADWYKPNINTNARFVCGDPHVDPRQWSLLVAYWDSEKGQHRSAMGVINRSRSIMGHATGTKSFAQVRDEYAQDHGGVEPNRIQMFNLTHRRANGEPDDARSKAVIVDLEQRINAFKNTAENNDAEMTNKVIDEMFVVVFGPEKHNNVRGYGIGVVPNDMPHLVREKRGLGMKLQSLKVAYKEQAVEFAKKTQEQREELDLTKLALDHYMRELVRVRIEHQQMELNFDGRVSSALDKYLRSSIDGGSGSYEVSSTSSPPLSSMFPANTLPANPLPSMEDID